MNTDVQHVYICVPLSRKHQWCCFREKSRVICTSDVLLVFYIHIK